MQSALRFSYIVVFCGMLYAGYKISCHVRPIGRINFYNTPIIFILFIFVNSEYKL